MARQQSRRTPRGPTVISLFSGAGGLDYFFEAAGFYVAASLEIDRDCCASLRASRRDRPVIDRSVFDVSTAELLETAGLKKRQADVLIGGPPCQPFSKAGYWARGDSARLDDPRANTLAAYMRIVEEALPQAFLLENVEGLAFEGKDEGLRFLLDRIDAINRATRSHYVPVVQKVDAAGYGVPQHRERVIIVAARDGSSFAFPTPTHGDSAADGPLFRTNLPTYRTAWDAIADVGPEASESACRSVESGALCSRPFQRERTICSTPSVERGSPCSAGAAASGRSFSSSRRIGRRGRCKPSRVPRSVRSTGATEGSARGSCVASRPSPTTSSLSAAGRPSRNNSGTPCPPSWAKRWLGRFPSSFSDGRRRRRRSD